VRVVDAEGLAGKASEGTEIGHLAAAVEEGDLIRGAGLADDLSNVVHAVGEAAGASQGSQVGHVSVVVQKGVCRYKGGPGEGGSADHISGTINSSRLAERTAQCAKVRHRSIAPQERVVDVGETRMTRRAPLCDRDGLLQIRPADDLAVGVDTEADRRVIAECAQVGDRVGLRACVGGSASCQTGRNSSDEDDYGKHREGHDALDECM